VAIVALHHHRGGERVLISDVQEAPVHVLVGYGAEVQVGERVIDLRGINPETEDVTKRESELGRVQSGMAG
jgi:hypothetical protein